MIKIILLLFISIMLFSRGYDSPDNRSQAKNLLKMIDLDYKTARLTGCSYTYDISSCMDKTIVDISTCSLEDNQTIQWIQVVPDTFFGRNMVCMNEKVCVNVFTKEKFGSPMCCRRVNTQYKKMEADLFNLIPVVSEIAAKRGTRIFSDVKNPSFSVGSTKFDTDHIEPHDEIKGDIARVYLYMDEQYDLALSKTQKEVFMRWHKLDPVDKHECAVAKIILKVQGTHNVLVENGCRPH
jgi:deoxyribonuclease-1